MKDYYEILGIEMGASAAQIKKAYFAMVRKYPPEGYPEKFMEIRKAYETLSNEETRREYDSLAAMPEDVRLGLTLAQERIERGNLKRAISLLEDINRGYPDLSVVESMLGEAYLANNNTGKAIKIFEELVKKHPENASFSGELANSYLDRGWHKKAIDAYKKAIELDRDNIALWLRLSEAYMTNGEFIKAEGTLKEALRLSDEEESGIQTAIYFDFLMIEVRKGNIDGLKEYLEKLTAIALGNQEERDIIAGVLLNIAQNMCEYEIYEPAKEMLLAAQKIITDDKGKEIVDELIKRLDNPIYFDSEIDRFDEDKKYNEEFISFVEAMLLPDENIGEDEIVVECTRRATEKNFLEKFFLYKKYINMLMEDYPGIYEELEDYFKRMENHKERRNRIKECNAILDNNSAYMESVFGRMEKEDCFDDDEFNASRDYEIIEPYIRQEPKVGRNDPCPCGSGKKYKKCCGR